MHVPYACQHAGACCSSGWPIPIERVRVPAAASLRPDRSWLRPAQDAPPDVAGLLAVSDGGHCIFHRAGCEIQRAHGHGALPSACQHFPRVVLLDARGVFVSLSHYCPTAAALLFTHTGRVEIVEGPPAIPVGEPEGLDARDVLPPLLLDGVRSRHATFGVRSRHRSHAGTADSQSRHGETQPVLMDLAGYSAWEAYMVDTLANTAGTADDAIERLDDDLRRLQTWRPGRGTLAEAVKGLSAQDGRAVATQAVDDESVIKRYLAARAFGSWSAYQCADGIPAVVRELRHALATVRQHSRRMSLKEAIRQTDLQILHLANR